MTLTIIVVAAFGLPILLYGISLLSGTSMTSSLGSSFDEQWPPMTDEEFLERFDADMPRDIALGVRRMVSEQRFIEDLGA
jgi:hypothetical protein